MISITTSAFILGMAAAVPMGPVGTLLLRVPAAKWKWSLASLLLFDFVLAAILLSVSDAFIRITSLPLAKIVSGIFLILFSIRGIMKQQNIKMVTTIKQTSLRQILSVAIANPGTYLLMASAFLFLDMGSLENFGQRWVVLASLSLGAVSWYHLVRQMFLKRSSRFQLRFERSLFMMIGIIGAITCLSAVTRPAHAASVAPVNCKRVASYGKSYRQDCKISFAKGSKTIHALTLRGAGAQISFDHGYLMAVESEAGVLMQTHNAIRTALNSGPILGRGLKKKIFDCMRSRVQSSVGDDFSRDVSAFYDGYRARMSELGKRAKFSKDDVTEAALAIELSIIMEGVAKRAESNQGAVVSEMSSMCGVTIPLSLVGDVVGLFNPFKHGGLKLGCIGGVLPENQSANGSLMHIRNLDGNLVETWNKAPVVALVKRDGSHPFVAGATAGLIYIGGISGYNAHGISASLHEMSTERYQSSHGQKRGILAPYMMQKIFEKSRSIDEAIKLIKSHGHFGAWTFLISDANTGETASVEVSGYRVSVARRSKNTMMAQSNHFLGKGMAGEAFTYSFNKYLESWSRYYFMENSLKAFAPQSAGVNEMIDILSGHQDIWEGRRAFGRTATKAYTILSTITAPSVNEFWVTAGERMPASHSNFVRFQVDFENALLSASEARRTDQFRKISSWEHSLAAYVEARLAYVRGDSWKAIEHMKQAKVLAQKSGINEPVYLYILGRLYFSVERYDLAAEEFNKLVAKTNSLHDYGKATLGLMQMANMVYSGYPRDATFQGYVDKTGKRLWTLYKKHGHFDLKKKIDIYDQLIQGKKVKLPDIDFVTVE